MSNFNKTLLIAAVILMVFLASRINQSSVTVVNLSTHDILSGNVRIAQNELSLAGMKPSEQRILHYHVRGDDAYAVHVRFSNTKEYKENVGYVTNGMRFKDTLTLMPTGSDLQQKYNQY